MIVLEASALANAFTNDGTVGQQSRAQLFRGAHWAAPQHLIVETFSAVRGRHLGGKVTTERATDALDALMSSTIELLSTMALLPRMWQLRHDLTGYDAAYIAAAEAYDCPLVTGECPTQSHRRASVRNSPSNANRLTTVFRADTGDTATVCRCRALRGGAGIGEVLAHHS